MLKEYHVKRQPNNPAVKVGDKIRITRLDDPYTRNRYDNRVGTITHIDDIGTIFGTWGGLGLIPTEDEYEIVNE